MFKKTKRKIVASIMSVLVLLWVGTLAIIYASSYLEMEKQNRGMLCEHAEHYTLSQRQKLPPPENPEPNREKPRYANAPAFRLSTFYTVAMAYDGEILEIKNPQERVHSDQELEELARDIVSRGKTSGVKRNLIYYAADKGEYILVAFKDNTIINESMNTLFRYTLLFGGVAIVALFFLAVFLAGRIVKPLEESYRKQKQFISDAGHELKTPVSVVSTNAELLGREIGENPWLSNIQYENERMGLLVGQLLELAHTEQVSLKRERVDLSHLVQGEVLPFESVAFEKGRRLRYQIEPEILMDGSSAQLKQMVSVLLDNAIGHSTEGSEVSLTLSRHRGWARLSVVNEGPEIPPEQRSQIFERFYRVDMARNGEHYGLGLAIAKSIVTAHKGRIYVSCACGLVEFRVELPTL